MATRHGDRRMKRGMLITGAVLVTAAIVAAGVFVARHDWEVEEWMEKVHGGPSSPFERLETLAIAAAPDWAALQLVRAPLDEMCRALLAAKSPTIRQSSDGYVEAVGRLGRAISDRDLPSLRSASQDLRKSCGDCHAAGGVGGELPAR